MNNDENEKIKALLQTTMLLVYQQDFAIVSTPEKRSEVLRILDPLKDHENGWTL